MPDLISLLRAGRLHLGTGLILLALWGQTIAPLAALHIPAAVAALDHSAICGHSENAPAIEDRAPGPTACKACPLCAVGLSSPLLPQAPSVARRQAWRALVWPIPPPASPDRPHCRSGQARAPPPSS